MKTTKFQYAVQLAAQMLVSAQLDILKEVNRASSTGGGMWLSGKATGARHSAWFILRQLSLESTSGRKEVASAIRKWVAYFRNDFRKLSVTPSAEAVTPKSSALVPV